ncbi:hypothetical protein ROM48_06245 [Cronobacter malonaticus]|uniref:hypothetical protein n=1 Tax=Cronobacter malonaticus TaxID=413503 RepID=UPI002894B2B0|nr:hypothetical protein [Cronobacter malonaticus]ELY3739013.1 hypothetical protein [Cronobacter sakazakii]MDT3535618.1 hypothetical protein [Cronobacter malonaticus]
MKTIIVKVEVEVPGAATDKDISDWVDVQYGEWNSMKSNNPCIDNYEVQDVKWEAAHD